MLTILEAIVLGNPGLTWADFNLTLLATCNAGQCHTKALSNVAAEFCHAKRRCRRIPTASRTHAGLLAGSVSRKANDAAC